MKRKKRKRSLKCPNCGSKKTIKNGSRHILAVGIDRHSIRKINRYKCKECGKSFTLRREKKKKYSNKFKLEIVRMHIEERQSYRVISKRIKEKTGKTILAGSLCKMVNEIAGKTKGSIGIKNEYSPKWEGYLTIDDKYINIKGRKYVSLAAIDSSGDPIHSELLSEGIQDEYDNFFRFIVEHLEYPIKAITTDLDAMLEKSVKRVLGEKIPHQKCVRHAIEALMRLTDYQSTKKKYLCLTKPSYYILQRVNIEELKSRSDIIENEYKEKEEIVSRIRKLLYNENVIETKKEYMELKNKYGKKYHSVIKFLEKNLKNLLTHQSDKKIPKTNNIAESYNRQIERRLKTIEAFQNIQTAFNYLNMIRNYIRFKPYTDCKGRRKKRNGKSPIELCGVILRNRDWLSNSLNLYERKVSVT